MQALDVTKAVLRLNHRRSRGDSVEVAGTVATPAGGTQGKSVQVDVGGVVRTFVLDARGRGVSGPDTFRLTTRRGAATSRFSLVVRRSSLGFVARDWPRDGGTAKLLVDLFVDRVARRANVDVDYVVRGSRAVARSTRN